MVVILEGVCNYLRIFVKNCNVMLMMYVDVEYVVVVCVGFWDVLVFV